MVSNSISPATLGLNMWVRACIGCAAILTTQSLGNAYSQSLKLDKSVNATTSKDDDSGDDIDLTLLETQKDKDGIFRSGPLNLVSETIRSSRNTLSDRHNLNFSASYRSTSVFAESVPNPDVATGGDFDLFATWAPLKKKGWATRIGANFEYRHTPTALDPSALSSSVGSLWGVAGGVSGGPKSSINQLWLEQSLLDEKLIITVGQLDHQTYYAQNAVASSSSRRFVNEAFSSKPAIAFPGNGAGVNLTYQLTDRLEISTGIGDASGNKGRSVFDDFGENEYFLSSQLTYKTNLRNLGAGNYRIVAWHLETEDTAVESTGGGFSISADQELTNRFVSFVRYSRADRNLRPTRELLAIGLGVKSPFGRADDYLGGGVAWGDPSDQKLREQTSLEFFYRFQLTPKVEVTPSIQMVFSPSNNLERDSVPLATLRIRAGF